MLQSFLSLLAIINIRRRNVPSRNLSLVVAPRVHRVVTSQKPAITSITFAQAQLQLETSPTRDTIPVTSTIYLPATLTADFVS